MSQEKTPHRPLAKRFYEQVTAEKCDEGYQILLDKRPIKTPLKHPLTAPTAELAGALVDEWDGQTEVIDPTLMPLTKMVNTAIDRIPEHRDGVIEELVSYAGSDMVCYRASEPDSLIAQQSKHWDPLLIWLKDTHDISLRAGEGVIHISQDKSELDKIRPILSAQTDFFLSAFHSLTTLSGSFTVALACAQEHITPEKAWTSAHLDADWQAERWGQDEEAISARANAYIEFEAAARLLKNL